MVAAQAKPRKTDFTLLILALALTCIGIMLVFDASYSFALQMHLSPYKYVGQQAALGAFGVGVMVLAMRRPYWKWRGSAVFMVAASIVLLVAVFVPDIGVAAKGAHRWVGHGALRFQPSELAKLSIILYIARVCAGKSKLMANFLTGPLQPLCILLVLAIGTAVEPDMGTCLIILLAGLGTLFFAGMRRRHLLLTLMALMALGLLFFGLKAIRHPGAGSGGSFQIKRFTVFLHPERDRQGDGYQVYHSTIALGTGGATGLGIGEGREKLYLPEAYTDFIFSVVGEEGGLVLSLSILLLLVLLVARGFHIATTTRDPYGALLAAGIATMFGVQTFINIGVVTSSIPATGVPLPFISYGGSSLVFSLIMVGILLNIARYPDGDPTKLVPESARLGERTLELRWNSGESAAQQSPRRERQHIRLETPTAAPALGDGPERPQRR